MKKNLLVLVSLIFAGGLFASGWVNIRSESPAPARVELQSSDINTSVLRFSIPGFSMTDVITPQGAVVTLSLDNASPMLVASAPDLLKITASIIIPDLDEMDVRIVSSRYQDFHDLLIAPSKGNLYRDTDPATVPFVFGPTYQMDQFFPGNLADLREPFIIRDLRGQTVIAYPFQYNPVTKTLRVYYDLVVEVFKKSNNGLNPMVRNLGQPKIGPEFSAVYQHHFLNFDNYTDYTPLDDHGKILVISYGSFMNAMQPLVDWRNMSGTPCEMVDVATVGTTATAIKNYISNYYTTNGLTFVLLVGDNAQIPTNQGGGLGGPSDNAYGYLVGNDHYPDVFVGRFSAENIDQVETQVVRTIDYEKTPQLLTDDWYTSTIGIASNQGPGDDNEYDYQHIRNLQTQMLAYTYIYNFELFDGSQGGHDATGNPTPSQVADAVNDGGTNIVYCGHGSATSWGTSGFSNSNVNALLNENKLPFIWSVACVNGNFLSTTCFAEAWLRAEHNGNPIGAVGFLGSTINQSWNPPMEGQDEMVSILVESYANNIKRTFGGLSMNGCMKMNDTYGSSGDEMTDTWNIFGDPALMVRTDKPENITATYDPFLFVGATSMSLTCNVNGAVATASINNSVLGSATVTGGSATITFNAPVSTPGDTVTLVIVAYNHIPLIAGLPVITPNGPYIVYTHSYINDSQGNNNGMADYGEDILLTVGIKNIGTDPAQNLIVQVTTIDPYATMLDSEENYGTVIPNEVKEVPNAFEFHVANDIPDGHIIHFNMLSTDGTDSWSGSFVFIAHAPAINYSGLTVSDPSGNNNNRLDPGETADMTITLINNGSAPAYNVVGTLIPLNPYITVTSGNQAYGDMNPGQDNTKSFAVEVDDQAPQGITISFIIQYTGNFGIGGFTQFSTIIGQIPVMVIDLDFNQNSADKMIDALESLDVPVTYSTEVPANGLDLYSSVFVCLGTYSDNHTLSSSEGQQLADYLDQGGNLYMEGADTWKYDPQTAVHPKFKIIGLEDGSGDLGTIQGKTGTFTDGMSFNFVGDNAYIDRISWNYPAYEIFKNADPSYINAVAQDATTYKTIGTSFEFGGLADGSFPSTKKNLMKEYLNFFGITPPPLLANFFAYPTTINLGDTVEFLNFSSGPVVSYSWSFPGGDPSTSTEANPKVVYSSPGYFDVSLTVSDGTNTNTMLKPDYIHADNITGAPVVSTEPNLLIYPNPASDQVIIQFGGYTNERIEMSLYNSLGTQVDKQMITVGKGGSKMQMDVSSLPEGIYLIAIRGTSINVTKKLVVR